MAGTSAFSGQVHSPYLLMDTKWKWPSGARGVVLEVVQTTLDGMLCIDIWVFDISRKACAGRRCF